MGDCMYFPRDWRKFLNDYSFNDHKEFYTNGARLISTFRVEQMMEHYLQKVATEINDGHKWIPVTERLPERGQEVIVASYRMIKPVVFVTIFWNKEHDNWYGITHWMPLPEPPKED